MDNTKNSEDLTWYPFEFFKYYTSGNSICMRKV